MASAKGTAKHQNKYAWKPDANRKKNETELGGKLRPYSDITGVCPRCKNQIEWKRRYGKYKPLVEPAKCQKCGKRTVRQAYHNICSACSKDLDVCAKCSCHVGRIIGRDNLEVVAEQKALEEAIRNARERDRRTLLHALLTLCLRKGMQVNLIYMDGSRHIPFSVALMNKGKTSSATAHSSKPNGGKGEDIEAAVDQLHCGEEEEASEAASDELDGGDEDVDVDADGSKASID